MKNAEPEIPVPCEIPLEAHVLHYLPIAAAVADFSLVRRDYQTLTETGLDDFEVFLVKYPDELDRFIALVSIVWYNEEAGRSFGLRAPPVSGSRIGKRMEGGGLEAWKRVLVDLAAGKGTVETPAVFISDSAGKVNLRVRATLHNGPGSDWSRVLLFFDSFRDGKGKAISRFDEWAGSKQLFRNLSLGFALHEMIFDDEDRPVDYRFLLVNSAFESMTGLRRANIIGRRAKEVVPDLEPVWIESYGEVVRTGRPIVFQSGSATLGRTFEVSAYRPETGLFAVMVQDITDRLRKEEAVTEREAFLRAVLETTGDGFFTADSELRIVDVNSSYCALMGYSREEMLSLTILDHCAASTKEKVSAHLAKIRRQGQDRFETLHRRADGSVVDVEITASYLGGDTRKIIAFCRDISQRKRTERLVRDQDERLSLALDGTGAGLWDWNMVTGDMLLDRNWGKLAGYSLEETANRNMSLWAEICHPEDRRISEEALARHLAGELPRYECELRIRHKEGHWIWVLNQGELVERNEAGQALRMIGLTFEIGARKEAEEKLRTTLGEKEALVSELYHRTKNSMQLINAMLELKKQEVEDSSLHTAFDDIQNKILAMALVQEKLYQADCLTSIDLGSYVTDLVDRLRSDMPISGADIAFFAESNESNESERIEVSADIAIPCGLVLSELIGNSINHAFPRRKAGRISVSVRKEADGAIRLEEWDDGVGLPSGYDPRKSGRLGLRTVIGIGEEQLHGRVLFGSKGPGFSCTLTFKDIYYPKRV